MANSPRRGFEMFVHFDSSKRVRCDDCGDPTTVMHLSLRRCGRSLRLCTRCFRAMALAISHGSRKLRL